VAELGYGLEDFFLNFHGGRRGVLLQDLEEAVFAEFFIFGIAGFGYAVCVQDQAVAALQLRYVALERLICEDAQDDAALAEPLVRAVATYDKGRIVAGAHIAKLARCPIELRVKQGDEAIAGYIAAQESVKAQAQVFWS